MWKFYWYAVLLAAICVDSSIPPSQSGRSSKGKLLLQYDGYRLINGEPKIFFE